MKQKQSLSLLLSVLTLNTIQPLWAFNPLSFITNHIDSETLTIILIPENFIFNQWLPDNENMLLHPLILYGMHALMYRGATEPKNPNEECIGVTCYAEKMVATGLLMALTGAYITKNKQFAQLGVLTTAIGKLALLYRGLTAPKETLAKQSLFTKYAEIILALGIIAQTCR